MGVTIVPRNARASWEARLAREGLRVEPWDGWRPGGRALRVNPGKVAKWVRDVGVRIPISIAHEKFSAAVWRYPFRAHAHGGGFGLGHAMRPVSVRRQRRIVQLLAEGATTREIARRCRTSKRMVNQLRLAVLAWTDPDDREEG